MRTDPVKVAVIGFGFMGRAHADAYTKMPSAKLVAVGDSNPNGFRKWPAPYPVQFFTDLEQLLRKTDADVLDICLPTFLHEEFVLRAAERGMHVICEKPLALTTAECDRMLAAVEKAGVKFMVAQVVRFFAHYQKIQEIVDSGDIGEVVAISASRLSEPPQWANWFSDPQKSGGALFDLHIHDLDYVLSLVGMPQSVFTSGVQDERGCWNEVVNALLYPDKRVSIEASYRMPVSWPFSTALRVVGSSGAVEYNFRVSGNVDVVSQAQHSLIRYRSGATPDRIEIADPDPYYRELQYFIDCVKNDLEPDFIPPRQSRTVIAVLNAAMQSLQRSSVVDVRHLGDGGFRSSRKGTQASAITN